MINPHSFEYLVRDRISRYHREAKADSVVKRARRPAPKVAERAALGLDSRALRAIR